MLSVKQGGIKYHFLSLWYDSTWDWTQVSRAIGEHSNRYQDEWRFLSVSEIALMKEKFTCNLSICYTNVP